MPTINDADLAGFLYLTDIDFAPFIEAKAISRGGGTWSRGDDGSWTFADDHEQPQYLSPEDNEALQQQMEQQSTRETGPIDGEESEFDAPSDDPQL